MKSFCALLCIMSVFVSSLVVGESAQSSPRKYNDGVFIVYMGAAAASRNDETHLITSLVVNREALVHTYTYGFLGFAARLTAEEARAIAQKPGVVSVFPDSALELHTTRSWDFLNTFSDLGISATRPASTSDYVTNKSSSTSSSSQYVSDTIIGILDTGIWPESASFNDYGMGPVPARWKGTCQDGYDFNSSLCNRKIIGARYYGKQAKASARDGMGHGTHVASTAAGSLVDGASYYGLAAGTARGGSPTSRIAMYKVCDESGECFDSDLLKAFDDAIKDGVDVLSLSLGAPSFGEKPDFSVNVIAIGSFHAVERGIVVVCSAGNSGPYPSTVQNEAPWIFTVAASTLDRHFESPVILGDGNPVIKGSGIHFGKLKKTPVYPLVTGASAKLKNASVPLARACLPGSLDPAKVKGKIVVCEGDYSFAMRTNVVQGAGGIGIIQIVSNEEIFMAPRYRNFSGSVVTGNQTSSKIFTYISSTKNPVATILPTVTTLGYKPAPAVIYFSSRGPALASLNILKPDITAPGVDILAAWPDKDFDEPETPIPRMKPPSYNIISGTSMSCPHTSGTVASVKAHNPTFSVSALRSAVMTTAIYTNNLNAPITNASGTTATPYDFGAGQINPTSALDPGLVYETEIADYLLFLCATGYNRTQIRLISSTVPKHFKCPRDLSSDSISNINYPSIAISNLNEGEPKTITRIATNVGDEDSVYIATIEALSEIEVAVTPTKLVFTKDVKKVCYNVTFKSVTSLEKDIFGSITWTNGKYRVRSPIVVSTHKQS